MSGKLIICAPTIRRADRIRREGGLSPAEADLCTPRILGLVLRGTRNRIVVVEHPALTYGEAGQVILASGARVFKWPCT